MWWKSVLLGKSGALAGRGAQTPAKPMGFICYFSGKSMIIGEFHLKLCFCLNFTWESRFSILRVRKVFCVESSVLVELLNFHKKVISGVNSINLAFVFVMFRGFRGFGDFRDIGNVDFRGNS